MLRDLLIFAIIVVLAIILGIAVHPVLFLLLLVAAAWIAFRRPWAARPTDRHQRDGSRTPLLGGAGEPAPPGHHTGRTITVRVRFAQLRSLTRTTTPPVAISSTMTLTEVATQPASTALADHPSERDITLLGLSVSNVAGEESLQLEMPLSLGDEQHRPDARGGAAPVGGGPLGGCRSRQVRSPAVRLPRRGVLGGRPRPGGVQGAGNAREGVNLVDYILVDVRLRYSRADQKSACLPTTAPAPPGCPDKPLLGLARPSPTCRSATTQNVRSGFRLVVTFSKRQSGTSALPPGRRYLCGDGVSRDRGIGCGVTKPTVEEAFPAGDDRGRTALRHSDEVGVQVARFRRAPPPRFQA